MRPRRCRACEWQQASSWPRGEAAPAAPWGLPLALHAQGGRASLLLYPSSARIVFGGDGLSSGRFDDDAASGRDLLDVFVERVPSARFAGAAGRKQADEEAPARAPELDRHKHRIIVSDMVFKSR